MGGSNQHWSSDVLWRRSFRCDATSAKAKRNVQTTLSAMGRYTRSTNEAAAAGVLGEKMGTKHQRAARRIKHQNFGDSQELKIHFIVVHWPRVVTQFQMQINSFRIKFNISAF